MATKSYIFDFYLVKCTDETGKKINFSLILDELATGTISNYIKEYKGFPRDIYNISSKNKMYSAQVRKLRNTDLPEIGAIGGQSIPLTLGEGQGVLERNCFVYNASNQVLVWQNNIHSCTTKILAEFITILSGYKIEIFPILRKESYQKLLKNKAIKVKDLDIAVAKPSNPSFLDTGEPISKQLLDMMDSTGADRLALKLSTDLRRNDSDGFLSKFSLHSITSLLQLDPKRAKITVLDEENDIQYPIDLITDRLRNKQSFNNSNLKNIPATLIIGLANDAYQQEINIINEIIMGIS